MALRGLIAAAVLLAASCTRNPAPPRSDGLGTRIAPGAAVAVKPSPDGAFVAWLAGCAKVASGVVALGTQSCELRVAPASGGDPSTVAKGVTTLPHGFVWADARMLLALDGYDHATGEGTLVAWEGGATRPLAQKVRFYSTSRDGRTLGWIASGVLWLFERGVVESAVAMGEGVATFEFAPPRDSAQPPVRLLARRESSAGGELLALTSGKLTPIAAKTADYRFSPAGDFAYTVRQGATDALEFARATAPGQPVPVRPNVHSFTFAPDGSAIAFVADVAPGKQGDLWIAPVSATGRAAAPEKVATGVGEVRWAPRGGALAWLAEFEPAMRSGALTVRAPGQSPARLASKVSSFEFSPDGRAIAYLEHVVEGGYSVDLHLARIGGAGEPKPEQVARGVFGFDFAPEGDFLYYRSECVQNGDSCDLDRVPAGGGKPERIAQAVKTFDFDRRTAGRLLVGVQRPDGTPLSIAVWHGGKLTAVDRGVVAGSASFLAPDSSRLAYAVQEKGREGVYVASLPK